jgi:hypothetical protein
MTSVAATRANSASLHLRAARSCMQRAWAALSDTVTCIGRLRIGRSRRILTLACNERDERAEPVAGGQEREGTQGRGSDSPKWDDWAQCTPPLEFGTPLTGVYTGQSFAASQPNSVNDFRREGLIGPWYIQATTSIKCCETMRSSGQFSVFRMIWPDHHQFHPTLAHRAGQLNRQKLGSRALGVTAVAFVP